MNKKKFFLNLNLLLSPLSVVPFTLSCNDKTVVDEEAKKINFQVKLNVSANSVGLKGTVDENLNQIDSKWIINYKC